MSICGEKLKYIRLDAAKTQNIKNIETSKNSRSIERLFFLGLSRTAV